MESTVQAMVSGLNAPLDHDALRATRTDDLIYQFLPESLGAPARNNEEWKEVFTQLKALFSSFEVTLRLCFYDTEARGACLHGKVDTQSPIGPVTMEFVFMIKFNEAGDKMARIDEFFDSKVYTEFFGRVEEAMKQGGEHQ
ncbi:uncharacterized protein LTR77_010837 [Saxophila tyrrhenica]|uniref:SnoaL-like domain-containing protein n=1 Tax=Saxophila tyrrhenica TaxID=1690608 RepID=A0AAV9NUR0_9PEZI|nr:hypothetical protein LTR77_010837 [Saxophila tyrrhenica]